MIKYDRTWNLKSNLPRHYRCSSRQSESRSLVWSLHCASRRPAGFRRATVLPCSRTQHLEEKKTRPLFDSLISCVKDWGMLWVGDWRCYATCELSKWQFFSIIIDKWLPFQLCLSLPFFLLSFTSIPLHLSLTSFLFNLPSCTFPYLISSLYISVSLQLPLSSTALTEPYVEVLAAAVLELRFDLNVSLRVPWFLVREVLQVSLEGVEDLPHSEDHNINRQKHPNHSIHLPFLEYLEKGQREERLQKRLASFYTYEAAKVS